MENGKLVVDQHSLTVATGPEALPTVHESDMTVDGLRHVSSSSYSNRAAADRWSPADTDRFFEALKTWGTDFAMVARVFPNRSRRQIKNKFKREERVNAARVDAILTSPRQPSEGLFGCGTRGSGV